MSAMQNLLLVHHRKALCWLVRWDTCFPLPLALRWINLCNGLIICYLMQDQWFDMSIRDVRIMENEVKKELDKVICLKLVKNYL